MEAICKGHGSSSLGRRRSSRVGHKLATILLHSSHDYRRNRLRSDHDRASIVLQILQKMPINDRGIDSTTNGVRSLLDRAAIAARSGRDSGVLPRLVVAVRCSSGEGTVTIARSS